MISIKRSHLFDKLNPTALKAIEQATVAARMRDHSTVTLAHWLQQLIDGENRFTATLDHQGLERARIKTDIRQHLDNIPRSPDTALDFDESIEQSIHEAWIQASLVFNQHSINTHHWLCALLSNNRLYHQLNTISPLFNSLDYHKAVAAADELPATVEAQVTQDAKPAASAPATGQRPTLETYTTDLTAKAREGKLDPVIGRDEEIDLMLDVLVRRRQNNPLLLGEAGVGKTAIAEGFALKIAKGEVPEALKNNEVRTLDLVVLQAGASMKGEFEQRLHQVIEETIASPTPVILFIDEAHTLIGAGGDQGTGDAANLLKPALARGELKTIAATTWSEYKKFLEKDQALARRFQIIQVDEPDTDKAIQIISRVAPLLSDHHQVPIGKEAIEAAVKLSQRYIGWRHLPDKAISLLDTAAARVAGSLYKTPRKIQELEQELVKQQQNEPQDVSAIAAIEKTIKQSRTRLEAEKELVMQQMENPDADQKAIEAELQKLQQGDPWVLSRVDADVVSTIVQDWTGIPVAQQSADDLQTSLDLSTKLKERIIGQTDAIATLSERIKIAKAGLGDPNKPLGVFLLAGPSGIGKTETALALAELLYGDRQQLITLNMSEYQESHSVSKLKGAPPGYVGYGAGGVLTEAVRKKPFSLVLLDEIEKAHSDVYELFFQVFDKGMLEDSEGRQVDFKNTLILLTSNAASDLIVALGRDNEDLQNHVQEALLKWFPAAFLGRVNTLVYQPLEEDELSQIARLQMQRIQNRIADHHQIQLDYDAEVLNFIARRCQSTETGARMIDNLLNNQLLPQLSASVIKAMLDKRQLQRIHIGVRKDAFHCRYVEAAGPVTEVKTL